MTEVGAVVASSTLHAFASGYAATKHARRVDEALGFPATAIQAFGDNKGSGLWGDGTGNVAETMESSCNHNLNEWAASGLHLTRSMIWSQPLNTGEYYNKTTTLAQTAAGLRDATLKFVARQLVTKIFAPGSKKITIRYGWEFNTPFPIAPWSVVLNNSGVIDAQLALDYKSAFRRAVQMFREVEVELGYTVGQVFEHAYCPHKTKWDVPLDNSTYPGDDVVDIITPDAYGDISYNWQRENAGGVAVRWDKDVLGTLLEGKILGLLEFANNPALRGPGASGTKRFGIGEGSAGHGHLFGYFASIAAVEAFRTERETRMPESSRKYMDKGQVAWIVDVGAWHVWAAIGDGPVGWINIGPSLSNNPSLGGWGGDWPEYIEKMMALAREHNFHSIVWWDQPHSTFHDTERNLALAANPLTSTTQITWPVANYTSIPIQIATNLPPATFSEGMVLVVQDANDITRGFECSVGGYGGEYGNYNPSTGILTVDRIEFHQWGAPGTPASLKIIGNPIYTMTGSLAAYRAELNPANPANQPVAQGAALAITAVSVPDISARVGKLLTGTQTVIGTPTPTVAYQWRRMPGDVLLASTSDYTVLAADTAAEAVMRREIAATNPSGTTKAITLPIAVNYPAEYAVPGSMTSPGGPYQAHGSVHAALQETPALVRGLDYGGSLTVRPAMFPDGTELDWFYPNRPPQIGGVWGFEQLSYGNYHRNSQAQAVPALRVSEISAFTQTFDLTIKSADPTKHNLLNEFYLTVSNTVPFPDNEAFPPMEIGWYQHLATITAAFHNSGVDLGNYTDNANRVWNCRIHENPAFITLVRLDGQDTLIGVLDNVGLLLWLRAHERIDPTMYINGVGFGAEPSEGAGGIRINDYAVTFEGGGAPAIPASFNRVTQQALNTGYWTLAGLTATADTVMEAASDTAHAVFHLGLKRKPGAKTYVAEVEVEQVGAGRPRYHINLYSRGFGQGGAGLVLAYFEYGAAGFVQAEGQGGWTLISAVQAAGSAAGRRKFTLTFTTDATSEGLTFQVRTALADGTNSFAADTTRGFKATNLRIQEQVLAPAGSTNLLAAGSENDLTHPAWSNAYNSGTASTVTANSLTRNDAGYDNPPRIQTAATTVGTQYKASYIAKAFADSANVAQYNNGVSHELMLAPNDTPGDYFFFTGTGFGGTADARVAATRTALTGGEVRIDLVFTAISATTRFGVAAGSGDQGVVYFRAMSLAQV